MSGQLEVFLWGIQMQIKAIETKYKGYRFRSRLEARWAVFFDSLGIKWEYESEGYDLGNGIHYLPDFKVEIYSDIMNDVYAWIEIKGLLPNKDEINKCVLLMQQGKRPVYLFSGTPGSHEVYKVITGKLINVSGNNMDEITAKVFALEPSWYMRIKEYHIEDAIQAAKSARFEFGETP